MGSSYSSPSALPAASTASALTSGPPATLVSSFVSDGTAFVAANMAPASTSGPPAILVSGFVSDGTAFRAANTAPTSTSEPPAILVSGFVIDGSILVTSLVSGGTSTVEVNGPTVKANGPTVEANGPTVEANELPPSTTTAAMLVTDMTLIDIHYSTGGPDSHTLIPVALLPSVIAGQSVNGYEVITSNSKPANMISSENSNTIPTSTDVSSAPTSTSYTPSPVGTYPSQTSISTSATNHRTGPSLGVAVVIGVLVGFAMIGILVSYPCWLAMKRNKKMEFEGTQSSSRLMGDQGSGGDARAMDIQAGLDTLYGPLGVRRYGRSMSEV